MTDLDKLISENITKIVFSKPADKQNSIKKLSGRMIISRGGNNAKDRIKYQYEYIFNNKAFQENINSNNNKEYILKKLNEYRQADVWCGSGNHYIIYGGGEIKIHKAKDSNNVHVSAQAHDKEKNFIIREGEKVPILTELGIFTHDYKIKSGMNAKFKQINRFVELVDDVISRREKHLCGESVKKYSPEKELNIIDFGCGKSYLTFVLYYYFNTIKKLNARITGVDLKSDVIEYCNKLAAAYEYDGLTFVSGDIKDYHADSKIDVVVSLHGCDTATDYAIYNGIKWNAGLMFIAPCCQHEANETIKSENILSEMFKYGVLKERFSSLLTDSIRCSLLEANGYKVDLIEFVGFSHTPKNLLIRAEKTARNKNYNDKILSKVEKSLAEFSINQKLYDLLYK